MFQISYILEQILIRTLGSVHLIYGSGSGSGSCSFRRPGCKQKVSFFYLHQPLNCHKKVTKQQKSRFSLIFYVDERIWSRINNYGSGSRTLKNILIKIPSINKLKRLVIRLQKYVNNKRFAHVSSTNCHCSLIFLYTNNFITRGRVLRRRRIKDYGLDRKA